MTGENARLVQWIKMEHYRLHTVDTWPDSPHKEVLLTAIHSALQRLEADCVAPLESPPCIVCASTKSRTEVLEFPSWPPNLPASACLAA